MLGLSSGGGGRDDDDEDDESYTVCKLQIGLFGDINKWQSKLDGIANKYDTADEEGLHGVYTGVGTKQVWF